MDTYDLCMAWMKLFWTQGLSQLLCSGEGLFMINLF